MSTPPRSSSSRRHQRLISALSKKAPIASPSSVEHTSPSDSSAASTKTSASPSRSPSPLDARKRQQQKGPIPKSARGKPQPSSTPSGPIRASRQRKPNVQQQGQELKHPSNALVKKPGTPSTKKPSTTSMASLSYFSPIGPMMVIWLTLALHLTLYDLLISDPCFYTSLVIASFFGDISSVIKPSLMSPTFSIIANVLCTLCRGALIASVGYTLYSNRPSMLSRWQRWLLVGIILGYTLAQTLLFIGIYQKNQSSSLVKRWWLMTGDWEEIFALFVWPLLTIIGHSVQVLKSNLVSKPHATPAKAPSKPNALSILLSSHVTLLPFDSPKRINYLGYGLIVSLGWHCVSRVLIECLSLPNQTHIINWGLITGSHYYLVTFIFKQTIYTLLGASLFQLFFKARQDSLPYSTTFASKLVKQDLIWQVFTSLVLSVTLILYQLTEFVTTTVVEESFLNKMLYKAPSSLFFLSIIRVAPSIPTLLLSLIYLVTMVRPKGWLARLILPYKYDESGKEAEDEEDLFLDFD